MVLVMEVIMNNVEYFRRISFFSLRWIGGIIRDMRLDLNLDSNFYCIRFFKNEKKRRRKGLCLRTSFLEDHWIKQRV